ncbi:MAG: hypothetical protein AMJ79_13345 [Phycisphaerae bacterium SM23_30]|nr:MAG: hypothetical protein AMJ79_13345 [Phycisphaerae bacterium SM23_30]
MKFLSHREMLRFWQRALARAEAPVIFSCGFNPHMRLSLPLPRSVGMSSLAELLILELDERRIAQELWTSLRQQLPAGIELQGVKAIRRDLNCNPKWARYRVTLNEGVDRAALGRRLEAFRARDDWLAQRPTRRRHPRRTVNVRRGIRELQQDDQGLLCTIDIQPQGAVRIDELLTALEIDPARQVSEIERIAAGYPPQLDINT